MALNSLRRALAQESAAQPEFPEMITVLEHRMMAVVLALIGLTVATGGTASAGPPQVQRHVVVFRREAAFAGWPANHGLWSWGNEILVGFSVGSHRDLGEERHNIDRDKPEYHVLARSLDGGETWSMEYPNDHGMLINSGGMRHGTTDPRHIEPAAIPLQQPMNFTHPDFCMTLRFTSVDEGESRMYYSTDRGHAWQGPFLLPSFGQPGVMARTAYLVNGPLDCHVFLTGSKQNRREGHVFCGRTTDGGVTWNLVAKVGDEPAGFAIMPSVVRLSPTELVMTVRRREDSETRRRRWMAAWRSGDNGGTWTFIGNPVEDLGEGNPPSLIRLQDGRLCVTYGVRKPPFEIQARFSSDSGNSWSSPVVLNTGGGGRDIGYPQSVQRPDGRIVTVYYFYTQDDTLRRIVATIWDPGSADR